MYAGGAEITLRTLLRSENPSATRLLAVALGSADPRLRVGAARALALREDPVARRALVEGYSTLSADARGVLSEPQLRRPLGRGLIDWIDRATPKLARRAVELAADAGLTDALPAAIEAAQWDTEQAPAIAADVLRLVDELARRAVSFSASEKPARDRSAPDPAFDRRAAVNALAEAVDRYQSHGREELVEAFLTLAAADEPVLAHAARDPRAPAHEAVLVALRRGRRPGLLALLGKMLVDPSAPPEVLRIACEREEPAALAGMFAAIGPRLGLRAREACRRIESFAWLAPERSRVLLELTGPAQGIAMQLAAASGAKRRAVATAVSMVLSEGVTEGRVEAARAIESLPSHLAAEPLALALASPVAAVVAVAARLARGKRLPNATASLLGLLDHYDERVRQSAQRSLRELSLAAFREQAGELPAADRARLGQLIGKADPLARAGLRAELHSGAPARRLDALELIETMGLAGDLADDLAGLLADPDAGVRAEAARLLGHAAPTRDLIEALRGTLRDPSGSVRRAAQASLPMLGFDGGLATEGVR